MYVCFFIYVDFENKIQNKTSIIHVALNSIKLMTFGISLIKISTTIAKSDMNVFPLILNGLRRHLFEFFSMLQTLNSFHMLTDWKRHEEYDSLFI